MEETVYNLDAKRVILECNKAVPNKKYTRRIYTNEEITEILKDYIEISADKYSTLKTGNTRVCYIRSDDNSFCRGGYINVNPIEKKDGTEIYMQLRGNISRRKSGMVQWMLPYSGIKRLWMYMDISYVYAKDEIKKSERKQRDELSQLVDKISSHLRSMKKEIRMLKKEVALLKDNDNKSVISGQTAITDFSTLKIYQDDDSTNNESL